MAVTSSSKQKLCRKQPEATGGDDNPVKAKRRKSPEVRVVGSRIYDSENGKTCHQCRQKTMDFVAACKNQKNDKPCTFKFCHKCLFNRYGEKAEELAVVEDWNCPKCRGICNCSFCMKKRGNQPTGILVHTARSTGFSSVSELLHVKGSENVGAAKIIQGMNMQPTKHTASGADHVALSSINHDENSIIKKQKETKRGVLKENRDEKKTKKGKSKELQNSNTGDVNQEDVGLLMEINARVTRSGKQKETQRNLHGQGTFVKETKPNKTKIANEIPPEQVFKTVPLISNEVSKREDQASQTVRALPQDKKSEKVDPKELPSKKIECESKERKVTTPQKLDKDIEHLQIDVDIQRQQMLNMKFQNKKVTTPQIENLHIDVDIQRQQMLNMKFQHKKVNTPQIENLHIDVDIQRQQMLNMKFQHKKVTTPQIENLHIDVDIQRQQMHDIKFQHKEAIAEIVMPRGSELNVVAGIELKPEDVGHALQFLEFCAAFGKILDLKKGEAEYILRELITGGRARRGKVSAVYQFHTHLVSMLLEELGESSIVDSTNGRTSWLQALKDCTSISQSVLEKLKLKQFEKGSKDYDSFDSFEKLVLLNYICDELLCTEKLRSWIDDQNMKHSEKMKEAKEKVLAAKQKEKHLKQKMQDDIAKAVISKNGNFLSISEHDAIVSRIRTEAAQAHAEMLEAKGIVPDENKKPDAVRTQSIILDAGGLTYWRLKGHSGEANILLQDVGTWDAVGSGEKWLTFTAEQEKEINEYICYLRKRSTSKPSFTSRKMAKPMVETTVP